MTMLRMEGVKKPKWRGGGQATARWEGEQEPEVLGYMRYRRYSALQRETSRGIEVHEVQSRMGGGGVLASGDVEEAAWGDTLFLEHALGDNFLKWERARDRSEVTRHEKKRRKNTRGPLTASDLVGGKRSDGGEQQRREVTLKETQRAGDGLGYGCHAG